MSSSAKEYDDLKIVISRVDEICKFLNNLKKGNKSTKERIDILESDYKRLEQKEDSIAKEETNKKVNEISKRLDNVESSVAKTQERIIVTESEYKDWKNSTKKEKGIVRNSGELERFSLKMQCENANAGLKQGIHDLDEQISTLDEQYKLITGAIELKKSRLDDIDKRVESVEAEIDSIKKQKQALTTSDNVKCRFCDDIFLTRKEHTQHIETYHINKSKCSQCDKSFTTSSQLENHLLEHMGDSKHGTLKKYNCEKCGKIFSFRWRFEKHSKMHDSESTMRKCHYFNNGKFCPFEKLGCKFLHEEAIKCKYNSQCKYDKCQFRH